MKSINVQVERQRVAPDEDRDAESHTAFADDGVDLTLIHWFLELSCFDRLQAAQDMIDTVWMLREAE